MCVRCRWLGVLEEEFFNQGDKERELGIPISPLFDRAKQGVSKSQVVSDSIRTYIHTTLAKMTTPTCASSSNFRLTGTVML